VVKPRGVDGGVVPRGRFHDQLIEVARHLLEDADNGDDDASDWCAVIVVSGLACDAAAAAALGTVVQLDGRRSTARLSAGQTRKVRDMLRSKKTINLKPQTQRAFWEALTDDRLTRWPDWIRYVRCVDRRNSVLHEGVLPSRRLPARADAVEAVEVMQSLHAHLRDVTRRAAPAAPEV
jgi:hypothetical protein